jgi:hypothetical protein
MSGDDRRQTRRVSHFIEARLEGIGVDDATRQVLDSAIARWTGS